MGMDEYLHATEHCLWLTIYGLAMILTEVGLVAAKFLVTETDY